MTQSEMLDRVYPYPETEEIRMHTYACVAAQLRKRPMSSLEVYWESAVSSGIVGWKICNWDQI
jgi:hypothetical protein